MTALPSAGDLERLSMQGIIAYTARCGRRVVPLFHLPETHRHRRRHQQSVEEAISAAEQHAAATWLDSGDMDRIMARTRGAVHAGIAAERVAFASGDLDFRAALAARVAAKAAGSVCAALGAVDLFRNIPMVLRLHGRAIDPHEALAPTWVARNAAEITTANYRTRYGIVFGLPEDIDLSQAAWADYHVLARLRPDRRRLDDGIDPGPDGPLGPLWPGATPHWSGAAVAAEVTGEVGHLGGRSPAEAHRRHRSTARDAAL